MKLPEQECYSPEDAAERLGKSVSYVIEMIDRGLLNMRRDVSCNTPGVVEVHGYIARQDLEQFEQTYGGPKGEWKHKKEAAKHFDFSEKTLERRMKAEDKKVKKGLLKEQDREFQHTTDGKRVLVFVPAKYLSK